MAIAQKTAKITKNETAILFGIGTSEYSSVGDITKYEIGEFDLHT